MSPIDLIVALVLLAGLLQNQVVLLSAGALLVVLLWGTAVRVVRWLPFKRVEWAIVICLAYWILNYFWSTRDLHNFFSFSFLRQDGALLVSYTTFIGLLGWPLKPRQCRAFWIVFLTVLGLLAIPGVIISLNLPHPRFLEALHLVSFDNSVGGDMFYLWYEAHNTAGGVYALASLMALILVLEEKLDKKGKVYLWFLLMSCVVGLAFTYSRGAYLGFVVGALFAIPLRRLSRLVKTGLLIVVPLFLIILMTSSFMSRIDTITDPHYGTNAARLDFWSKAWDDFTLSPIVGIGFGRYNDERVTFEGIEHFVYVGTGGFIMNNNGHAHNSYLHFLAEGGIVGLALTMNVWWSVWMELSLLGGELKKSKLHWLLSSSKSGLIAILVMSITEHMLGRGSVVLVEMALAGMALSSARVEWATLQRAKRQGQILLKGKTPIRANIGRATLGAGRKPVGSPIHRRG